ncbi:MAG TPA: type VI secretion system membrane subunit TssM [Candidatus Eisenbacteria bacterium]|nr:type VI secretion system membrane subunit TssM [Candidatus Eisenbacteria bacterium]
MNPLDWVRLPQVRWVGGVAVGGALLLVLHAFGMTLVFALLLVLIVALVVAIVLLIRALRQSAAAEEIERTLSTQADADIEKSTPGQLAEMQRLKEELLAAIDALKASGRKTGEDALAKLPWYMVIGPAGAGKSELIKRSGLEFPLRDAKRDPRAVRGVGGTRGFSWWLANEAVLLDMAGRTLATAAFDDSGDWMAFLATLRRQRPEKPVNGVIVLVAVDQIADQPEARVDSLARAARERLQELVQHLGVVFPVYVVFNRCDQLAGFAEFFEDLSAEERVEPWGATLSMERARAHAAEQLFDEEFSVLAAALSERRLPRMAAMPEATTRARAFAFPLQFERVRGSLRRFVRTLFEAGGTETPLFRGFYFTAAAQEGEPTDRVLQPAVRTLGLTVRPPEGFGTPRGGAWFVRDLLREVVFPDAALAVSSRGAQGRLRQHERLLVGGFGIAFAALALMFIGFSCGNNGLIDRAHKGAVDVGNHVDPNQPLVDNLRSLEHLRSAAYVLDSLATGPRPLWRVLGGYSGDVVRDPAVELWMRKTVQTVVAPAVNAMEQELKRLTDTNQGSFLDYYYLFRAWRLLHNPTQIQPADADVLTREMRHALESQLAQGQASPEDRLRYPELLRRQVAFLARHPRELAGMAHDAYAAADPDLVARGGARIKSTWDSAQFYRAMVAETMPLTRPSDLSTLLRKPTTLLRAGDVPGPYTKDGWFQQVKPRIEAYRTLVQRDWLLQDLFGGRAPDLAGDVLALYAKDYSAHWARFVSNVALSPPADMPAAANQLAMLAKEDSPLFEVLRAVRTQTQLGEPADSPMGRMQSDFTILRDFFSAGGGGGGAAGVLNSLTGLFRKPAAQGGDAFDKSAAPSAVYLGYLKASQAAVNQAAQPGRPASDVRKLLETGDDTTNPLRQLVAYAQRLGQTYGVQAGAGPVSLLLQAPVGGARAAVVTTGLNPAMAAAWKSIVLDRFRNDLGSKYPFAAGGPPATLDDVAACFSSKGYFWTFFQQQLAPFMSEDGTPKSADVPVSAGMREFVHKAYGIRQAFFSTGDQAAMAFTASSTPPRMDGPAINVRWVALDCGGENATYTMGPEQDLALHWPGQDPTAGAAVRAQAAPPEDPKHKKKKGQPDTIPVVPVTQDGLWGMFRLLDQAQSVTQEGGAVYATWLLNAGATRLHVVWKLQTSAAANPFARGFMRLNPPESP